MDDNERESVDQLLRLAKIAIVAMMVIGGYVQREMLIGLV